MRLFGKKANPQSGMSDVPPELLPYYREQAVAAHAHRTARRFMLIFTCLIVVVGGSMLAWLRYKTAIEHVFGRRTTTVAQKNSMSHASTPANTSQSASSSTTSPPASSTTTGQPTNTPTPAASQSPTTPASSSSQTATSTTSTPSLSSSPASIPNTGPGVTIVFVAIALSMIAMIVYHIRQRRSVR